MDLSKGEAVDLYYETDQAMLEASLEVPRESRFQWLLDHSQPSDEDIIPDWAHEPIVVPCNGTGAWSEYEQAVELLLDGF